MSSISPINPSHSAGVNTRFNWKGVAKVGNAARKALSEVQTSASSLRFTGKQEAAPLKTVQGVIPAAAASHLQTSGRKIDAVHVR